ncbi:hypothetical protein KP509_09G024000 [Ceratopteris richardii]|nr:hypothetical protein KP509_09G024000 [Ceratopteris richardii]
MYGILASIEDTLHVFATMPRRNVFSWATMIVAYVHRRKEESAVQLFLDMLREGVIPINHIFSSILGVCTRKEMLKLGTYIHIYIQLVGLERDPFVGTALVDMYGACDCTETARAAFDRINMKDVVSWTAMIMAYGQHGEGAKAFEIYLKMKDSGVLPNEVTYCSLLNACANLLDVEYGKIVHAEVCKLGLLSSSLVNNALSNMYGKSGSLEEAEWVFHKLSQRDVVSWNCIISSFASHGQYNRALYTFVQMSKEEMDSNDVTFISILQIFSDLAAPIPGRNTHSYIIETSYESYPVVSTALVTMYGKCGSLEDAEWVFYNTCRRDVISWSALIAAHAYHGHGKDVVRLFEMMKKEGIKPDEVTFVSLLSSCSHSGLIDEASRHFRSMKEDQGLSRTMEHYACMVDLHGRIGQLEEAEKLIYEMPFPPNHVIWEIFLAACRVHRDMKRGRVAAEQVLQLAPDKSAPYVLLSNLYASEGKWEEELRIRKLMIERGVKKQVGCSSVEVGNVLHRFIVRDRSHPRTEEIYAELERLHLEMKAEGYIPETNLVLHDVEEELKEQLLSHHSEKLAIAFGLISTSQEAPLHIVKNLRICSDCHTAAKYISKIREREIIMRDYNRFHRFKNGLCSCGDYW